MQLSEAVDGFLLFKSAEGLSQRTLETYRQRLVALIEFLDDPELSSITSNDIARFIDYLRKDYVPARWSGDTSRLTGRSLRNYWVACRSFYSWASIELGIMDIGIQPPKANTAQVDPFTEREIRAMVSAARSPRDRAIILLLLDTGIRSSELCNLTTGDIELTTGKIHVVGKGNKERYCYMGSVTRKAMWKYMVGKETDALFTTQDDRALTRSWLRRIVSNTGKKANVYNAYPHRFRHTFAIQFLRNGGDVFTLQALLGHSSLEMVRRYAKLASIDAEQAHKKASPADHWLKRLSK